MWLGCYSLSNSLIDFDGFDGEIGVFFHKCGTQAICVRKFEESLYAVISTLDLETVKTFAKDGHYAYLRLHAKGRPLELLFTHE